MTLLAAARRAWSCAGPCRAKARTAARSLFEGFWAPEALPASCGLASGASVLGGPRQGRVFPRTPYKSELKEYPWTID